MSHLALNATQNFPMSTQQPLLAQPSLLASALLVLTLYFLSDNFARRRTHTLREKTAAGVRTIYGVECRSPSSTETQEKKETKEKKQEEGLGVWDGWMAGAALMLHA